MKFWISIVSALLFSMATNIAHASDIVLEGPPGRGATALRSTETEAPTFDLDKEYKRNRIMQVMGYAILAASVVLSFTGAALVEASPWGPVSKAGFICVGVGLGHFITSAFLLGFSRVIIRQELPPTRPLRVIRKTARARNGDIYFQ